LIDLTGSASVPVAIIRGEVVHGFSPEAYRRALGK